MARTTKTKPAPVKPTITIEPEQQEPVGTTEKAYEQYEAARERLLDSLGLFDWKRNLLRFVTAFVFGFAISAVGCVLTDMAMVAAVMLTGVSFLGTLVGVLGIALSMFAAITLPGYFMDGRFVEHMRGAKRWIASKFERSEIEGAAHA